MILFVTEQWAGAQYYRPLLERWAGNAPVPWRLAAAGASRRFWREAGFEFIDLDALAPEAVAELSELDRTSLVAASSMVGGGREPLVLRAAKARGVPVVQALDTWVTYRARFQQGAELELPDLVLAIDERCVEEARADGLEQAAFEIVGQPYLEELARRSVPAGSEVLLAGQPVAKYWDKGFGYDESDFWRVALEGLEGCPGAVRATRHPEEAERPGRGGVAFVPGGGLADVEACHTLLSMYSTQMLVAWLWGRKVASVQPGLRGADPCPLSRWGLVPRLETAAQVRGFLREPAPRDLGGEMREAVRGSLDRLEALLLRTCGAR